MGDQHQEIELDTYNNNSSNNNENINDSNNEINNDNISEKDDIGGVGSSSSDVVSDKQQIEQQQQQQQGNNSFKGWVKTYGKKWKGTQKGPKMIPPIEILFSWIGSFVGIGLVATIHYHVFIDKHKAEDFQMLIGSFAASAVLIYGAVTSPLAQPRNLVMGHIVSAIIGVALRHALQHVSLALASALAVSVSIVVMQLTKCLHPPGGATALIAVMSTTDYRWAGFFYVFMPVATGVMIMLLVALVINNLSPKRSYPLYWW